MKKLVLGLIVIFVFIGCSQREENITIKSFYTPDGILLYKATCNEYTDCLNAAYKGCNGKYQIIDYRTPDKMPNTNPTNINSPNSNSINIGTNDSIGTFAFMVGAGLINTKHIITFKCEESNK